MLSIIVPVRNETDSLEDIFNYFTKNLIEEDYEVLIINDFSKDDTLLKAKQLIERNVNFKVFDNKKKD